MSIRAALLIWGGLGLFAVLLHAQGNPSGDEIRQLVESSRRKALSAVLEVKKGNSLSRRIEVFRRADEQGNMLEVRRHFKDDGCYLTTYRLPEGYYGWAGGKLMKLEIGGNFQDEEEPALSWDWGWEAILRGLGAEYTVTKKPVTIGKKQYQQYTVTTPVTVANLAAITQKSEAEVEPQMERLKAVFPSVKQLTVDEKENFIVQARMFSSTGRQVIELQWGKLSYREPALELFVLPEGKAAVVKTTEDMAKLGGANVPSSRRHAAPWAWVQRHQVWILLGVAAVALGGALALKRKRR